MKKMAEDRMRSNIVEDCERLKKLKGGNEMNSL